MGVASQRLPHNHPPNQNTLTNFIKSYQQGCNPTKQANLKKVEMKLLLPSLLLLLGALGALAAPPMPAEADGGAHNPPPYYALANYLQQQKRAEASALEKELLAEYLASQMGSPDYPEPEEGRMKRWWGGNKYRDNKSYGFWITALNKAGNVKRGKRSAFLPAMGAIVDDHNPLTGPSDYSDVAELVPDHKASLPLHQ